MPLLALPGDVLIIVMRSLSIGGLSSLARCCRFLNALVCEFGWANHLRSHSRPSYSLSIARSIWGPRAQVRYDTLTDNAWSKAEFIARPLSRPWQGKLQPLLAVSSSRLVVAAGSVLHSYKFAGPISDENAPCVHFEGSCALTERRDLRRDITSVVFVPDGGLDLTLFIGFEDGILERVLLKPPSHAKEGLSIERYPDAAFQYDGDLIESLSAAGSFVLSLSASGTATLIDVSSPTSPSTTIDLQTRSWSSHLNMHSSTPYAVLGTSSSTPLVVHSVTNAEVSRIPSAILYSDAKQIGGGANRSSAVYGIAGAPPSAPWGVSDQIIVSGWYDGVVRIHDLRASVRAPTSPSHTPTPLLPVLSLYDPWSFEPIYSVSCGGGSSSHIAAGSARHSVVSFWDVRAPTRGWSVHAPGNDSSPVYAVELESSRLFGATQSRPFVYDFGPGVTLETYPRFSTVAQDGLKVKKNCNTGYYVTKYNHTRALEVY